MFLSFTFYPEQITGCLNIKYKRIEKEREKFIFEKKNLRSNSWGQCDETKRDRKLIEKKVLKEFANYNNIV